MALVHNAWRRWTIIAVLLGHVHLTSIEAVLEELLWLLHLVSCHLLLLSLSLRLWLLLLLLELWLLLHHSKIRHHLMDHLRWRMMLDLGHPYLHVGHIFD
jgi:hypothetical protein